MNSLSKFANLLSEFTDFTRPILPKMCLPGGVVGTKNFALFSKNRNFVASVVSLRKLGSSDMLSDAAAPYKTSVTPAKKKRQAAFFFRTKKNDKRHIFVYGRAHGTQQG